MATNYTITSTNRWVNCTTAVGEVKNVTIADKAAGVICADNYPAAANDPLYIRGTLNVSVGTGLSYLGNGANGNLCMPTIYPTGVMPITGSGLYTAANYMYIPNDIDNRGVLSFQDIGLFAPVNCDLSGGGTLNLTNVRVVNTLLTYQQFGNITNQTINLNNSDVNISGTYTNVTINLSSTGTNYIGISKASSATNLKIRGLSSNSLIDIQEFDAEGYSYDPSTGLLTLSNQNVTKSLVIDIGLGYDPLGFQSISAPFGVKGMGVSYKYAAPCFLTGTLLETPSGTRAVEQLVPGDLVLALINGQLNAVPVKEIMAGVQEVSPSLADDEAGYAVCIKKDALGNNKPNKDMFVTSEHCLYLDGSLIPVRMLVNGTSIHYDKTQHRYDYYHVDLGEHHIIIADGLEAESYLPRLADMAINKNDALRHSRRLIVPAAPINTARDFVELIFHRITTRAGIVLPPIDPIRQSGLCLRLADGTTLQAESHNKGRYIFRLPADTQRVTLVSEAVRPCDLYGPFVDDRRALGVLVGHIALESNTHSAPVESPLQERPLQGWYADRGEACRWTNGQGTLSLPTIVDGVSTLSIEVLNEPAQQDNNADSGISNAAA